jgi:hypothetical protein
MRRELQKEQDFKAWYSSHKDAVTKEKEVLPFRNRNEVTLEETATALQRYFLNCYVTWNSGNIYTLVASNNLANIDRFIASGSEPASRNEHLYGSLPRPLFGEREHEGRHSDCCHRRCYTLVKKMRCQRHIIRLVRNQPCTPHQLPSIPVNSLVSLVLLENSFG